MTDGKVHLYEGKVLLDTGKVSLCDDDCCFGCVDVYKCDDNVTVCLCAPAEWTVDLDTGGWGNISEICGVGGIDSCCTSIQGEYDLAMPDEFGWPRWSYGYTELCSGPSGQKQELYMVFCPKVVVGGVRMQLTIKTVFTCPTAYYHTIAVYQSNKLDEGPGLSNCFDPFKDENDKVQMDLQSETSDGDGHACTTGMPSTIYMWRKAAA